MFNNKQNKLLAISLHLTIRSFKGEVDGTAFPRVFDILQYFETILPPVDAVYPAGDL